MPNLSATTFRSSIRQSRGLRRILAMSFAAFDTTTWYHARYHPDFTVTGYAIPNYDRAQLFIPTGYLLPNPTPISTTPKSRASAGA